MKFTDNSEENVLALARKGFKSYLIKQIRKEFPAWKPNEVAGWKIAAAFQKYESNEFEFWKVANEDPEKFKEVLKLASDTNCWWYIEDKTFVTDSKFNLKNSIPIWKFAKLDRWKKMYETYSKNKEDTTDYTAKEEDDFWNMTYEDVLKIKPKAPVKPQEEENESE